MNENFSLHPIQVKGYGIGGESKQFPVFLQNEVQNLRLDLMLSDTDDAFLLLLFGLFAICIPNHKQFAN